MTFVCDSNLDPSARGLMSGFEGRQTSDVRRRFHLTFGLMSDNERSERSEVPGSEGAA